MPQIRSPDELVGPFERSRNNVSLHITSVQFAEIHTSSGSSGHRHYVGIGIMSASGLCGHRYYVGIGIIAMQ